MTTEKFSEELTQLIRRWTTQPDINKDDADEHPRLSNRKVLKSVKKVMREVLEVNLQEVPKAEITRSRSSSPGTPCMPAEELKFLKCNIRQKSVDKMHPSSDSPNGNRIHESLSKSQSEMDVIESNTPLPPADKKPIPRPTSISEVHYFIKSGKSIHTQAHAEAIPETTEPQTPTTKNEFILNEFEVLKRYATDILGRLDKLKTQWVPQGPKPMGLPTIVDTPGSSDSSMTSRPPLMSRKNDKPKISKHHRRPTTLATQGRSTSSVASGPVSTSDSVSLQTRIQSSDAQGDTSSSTDSHVVLGKFDPAYDWALVGGGPDKEKIRTPTDAPGSSQKKTSRLLPETPPSTSRIPKNPKYAHVQSTIPKGATTKKPK